MTEKLRRRMGRTAVEAAAAVQYVNAGTIEFLLDDAGNFYFMEMNTRIQVEHGVTELVTRRDLVKEQIHVASGGTLSFAQKDVTFEGHAIECRVNAEDPVTFVPSPGTIRSFYLPGGPGVRVDTAAHEGCEISPYYDSMIAKLMVHGRDRREAIARMRRCLDADRGRGDQDHRPAPPAHHGRPGLPGGALQHQVHGALPASQETDTLHALRLLPVALPRRPFLYAIVDVASLGGRRVGAVLGDLARGGAGLVQLRAKGIADGPFLDLALEAVAAARIAGVPVLINDRADIARLAAADGVHVGQEDLSPADARQSSRLAPSWASRPTTSASSSARLPSRWTTWPWGPSSPPGASPIPIPSWGWNSSGVRAG